MYIFVKRNERKIVNDYFFVFTLKIILSRLSIVNVLINWTQSSRRKGSVIVALLRPFETTRPFANRCDPLHPRFIDKSAWATAHFPFSPFLFTLFHLGIDVNGPQSELLVLVNHPPWGLPVEFSIWLDADVSSPGSQHPDTADPCTRHHLLLLSSSFFANGMAWCITKSGSRRVTDCPLWSAASCARPLERRATRDSLVPSLLSRNFREIYSRNYLIFRLISNVYSKKVLSAHKAFALARLGERNCDLTTWRSFYRVSKFEDSFQSVCLSSWYVALQNISLRSIYTFFRWLVP